MEKAYPDTLAFKSEAIRISWEVFRYELGHPDMILDIGISHKAFKYNWNLFKKEILNLRRASGYKTRHLDIKLTNLDA